MRVHAARASLGLPSVDRIEACGSARRKETREQAAREQREGQQRETHGIMWADVVQHGPREFESERAQ